MSLEIFLSLSTTKYLKVNSENNIMFSKFNLMAFFLFKKYFSLIKRPLNNSESFPQSLEKYLFYYLILNLKNISSFI